MNFRELLKKRWMVITLEVLFFIALFLVLRAYMQRDMISGMAPPISAVTLQQQNFDLYNSQPKPLLVHFWATWCGICKLEQGSIQALSEDYNVITIAMQSGTDADVQSYLDENKLTFDVINDQSGKYVSAYGVRGVPASFVINSNNHITASEVGYTTGWGLRIRMWLAD
ncbi:MAG: protein disulfide oxidoreductase [Thioalkalispiraceae bacterium]|jgi:thiol-disulfide isomerase/thioredoxin